MPTFCWLFLVKIFYVIKLTFKLLLFLYTLNRFYPDFSKYPPPRTTEFVNFLSNANVQTQVTTFCYENHFAYDQYLNRCFLLYHIVGIFVLLKFYNKLDIGISHIQFISKFHEKCKFKFIQSVNIPNLSPSEVVQTCQHCQLFVLWDLMTVSRQSAYSVVDLGGRKGRTPDSNSYIFLNLEQNFCEIIGWHTPLDPLLILTFFAVLLPFQVANRTKTYPYGNFGNRRSSDTVLLHRLEAINL